MKKGLPYGNLYYPRDFGSGGDGNGGTGGGVLTIDVFDTLQVRFNLLLFASCQSEACFEFE